MVKPLQFLYIILNANTFRAIHNLMELEFFFKFRFKALNNIKLDIFLTTTRLESFSVTKVLKHIPTYFYICDYFSIFKIYLGR